MATLPTVNSFINNPGVNLNSNMAGRFEAWLAFTRQLQGGAEETELTLDINGRVTPTGYFHTIDTYLDAATDNIETIAGTNLPLGSVIEIRSQDSARVPTIKHLAGASTDKIFLLTAADLALTSSSIRVRLLRTSTQWLEIDRFLGTSQTAWRSFLGLNVTSTYPIASQAEAIAGTALDRLMAPGRMADWFTAYAAGSGKVPYGRYSSPEQAIGSGVTVALNHSLGAEPTLVQLILRCKDADVGYANGDVVPAEAVYASSQVRWVQPWWNATQVGFNCVAQTSPAAVLLSTGALALIDASKWRGVIRAWR